MGIFKAICDTPAAKRYQRRVLTSMAGYMVVLFTAAHIVRQGHPVGWLLYFWSVLPAIPIMAVLFHMGQYLREEKDEYKRVQTVQSLLVGTAVVLGLLVVNDFLRAFAGTGAIEPFVSFVVFFLTFGAAQGVQRIRDRVAADE